MEHYLHFFLHYPQNYSVRVRVWFSRQICADIAQKHVADIAQKHVADIAQKHVADIAQKHVADIAQKHVADIAQKREGLLYLTYMAEMA